MLAHCAYFTCAGLDLPLPLQCCAWNTCLCATLCCGIHVAAGCHISSPPFAWALLATLAVGLPMATEDRLPFAMQPRGCPSWLHYSWAVFSLVLVIFACCMRDVSITLAREPHRGGLARTRRCLHVWFEVLPLLCALTSSVILACCMYWALEHKHNALLDGVYHVAWSWLRMLCAALFAAYWLKRCRSLQGLQALICGMGVLFFVFLCPLTQLHVSRQFPSVCDTDTKLSHSQERMAKLLAEPSHRIESMCLHMCMILFVANALGSDDWTDLAHGHCFRSFVAVCMLLAFLALVCVNIMVLFMDMPPVEFIPWALTHFLPGYLVMVLAEAYVLARLPRHRLTFCYGGLDFG